MEIGLTFVRSFPILRMNQTNFTSLRLVLWWISYFIMLILHSSFRLACLKHFFTRRKGEQGLSVF